MRNPNRLDKSYDLTKQIHKKLFPDMREGQFLLNFLGEMNQKHGDPFFWESDKFEQYLMEYAKNNSRYYKGWDLPIFKKEGDANEN